MDKNNNANQTAESNTALAIKFINPEKIIGELEIQPGMKVADFGCGTGYFTFPLSKKVGTFGIVYAFDVLESKIENINSQAKLMGLTNIVSQRANLELEKGSKLKDGSLDWVMLVNILFQNGDEGKRKIMAEAKRVLKKGGHILAVEWNELDNSIGPERKLRVSRETIGKIVDENQLTVLRDLKISDFHYGLIIIKEK